MNVAPTHSLQSPTVFTAVSRVTDRHNAVSGLVTLTNHASGATASTSRAMSSSTGTLRSARRMPPGPTLSPMGWRMPKRRGISMSCCMLSKPPTEKHVITKSAPASACLRSSSAVVVSPMPRRFAISWPRSSISCRRSASRSCSTTSASASDGVFAKSHSSRGAQW